MKPLEKWLADNGYPKATFWYHRKNNPANVPETIKIGRRHYVTDEQDREFKSRKMAEARAVSSTGEDAA